jgi:hypothetical protein
MATHEQAWVKVNVQVDAGIASLVEALSDFPNVRTIESCEGYGDSAWICFDCGNNNWMELSEFVFKVIGPSLIGEFGDGVDLHVSIAESGKFLGEMTILKTIIPAVADFLKQLPRRAMAA